MDSRIDYMAVLSQGLEILSPEQRRRFITEISGYRIKGDTNQDLEDEYQKEILLPAVHDVIVDFLNLVTPTMGRGSLRKKIIERARNSPDPDDRCRWEIQRLVHKELTRRSYTPQGRQLYRQVAKTVLEMEREGLLQSNMSVRKKPITRLIVQGRRDKKSIRIIAEELNQLGLRTDRGEEWTCRDVREVLIERGGPLKKVGLASWGPSWLRRVPLTDHSGLVESLKPIRLYISERLPCTRHEPKLFDKGLLPGISVRLLVVHDSALTIGQITRVIEEKFVPTPYRTKQALSLDSSTFSDERAEEKLSLLDIIPNEEHSSEEILTAVQMESLLTESLTSSEREIFRGLQKGESVREMADRLGLSIGTIANRMRSIKAKAVKLGLAS